MKSNTLKKNVLSALFLALGLVLPFFTGLIPQIGKMLLPMHIPAMLCGFICGPVYGLIVGALMPLCRSAWFHMPQLYPTAIAMAFELGAYGFISGAVFKLRKTKGAASVYIALLLAILGGRVVWGIVMAVLLATQSTAFTFSMFAGSAFTTALPGIILQLILIPAVMLLLNRTGLVPIEKVKQDE